MKNIGVLALSVFLILFACLPTKAQTGQCKNQGGPIPGIQASVNDTRSDSIDILKTTINLTITDITSNGIVTGNAKIAFKTKVGGINVLRLDLLSLTVDSVKRGSLLLTVAHTNEVVRITLPTTYPINTTDSVVVYYHGHPVEDPSGYGGFYFTPPYAYSIGVGFAAIPHNFGRCWYPCFDNFVERCLFDFNITTTNANTAICNGTVQDTTDNGNGTHTFFWRLQHEIPSYLSCVSVAPFVKIQGSYPTIAGGNVPLQLFCLAADSNKLKNSFTHLHDAFDIFENRFGPYKWEKVGYVLVPFIAGAMEHATCISYPTFLNNNTTTYETTMAHELSHMWFGDFVTCEEAGQMYLNEGFARYCEAIFLEGEYNYSSYLDNIRANHRKVLNFAYVSDSGYYAIDAVPQNVTYGSTTYEKGADVLHTLRSYMGDAAFFNGIKYYLSQHQYADVSTADLKTALETSSGTSLADFFSGWVNQPGFPHFTIDSVNVVPDGQGGFNATVHVRQQKKQTNTFFNNVPMTVTFLKPDWSGVDFQMNLSGEFTTQTFTLPFSPAFYALNLDDRISHAVTFDRKVFKSTGNVPLNNALMSINPLNPVDSALVLVEHNWVGADNEVDNTDLVTLSPDRYWRVSGIAKPGFVAKASFGYNGRTSSASAGWLDNGLITAGEDSLILMYRPGPGWPWKRCGHATQNTQGSTTDKIGRFDVDTLQFGEYCLAKGDAAVNVAENAFKAIGLRVYPNPATNYLSVESTGLFGKNSEVVILNSLGALVKTIAIPSATNKFQINLDGLAPGMYYLKAGTGYARFLVM